MTVLKYDAFSGIAPKLTRWKLPPQMAQEASNVNLESRTIKPWNENLTVDSGYPQAGTTSIFRFGQDLVSDTQYWLQWPADVDFVKGPMISDETERSFYTGDGAPKWTNNTLALTGTGAYPRDWRYLGVPAPTTAPSATVTGTGDTPETRVYCYTHISDHGEESKPSPSTTVTVDFGQDVTLSGFSAAPTDHQNITARRLYRSVTSSGGTTFYFVKEGPVTQTSIVDDVGEDIGEPLGSADWDVPPSTMFGLVTMDNGILVGFNGTDVCVAEQYVPYAWPYKYATAFKIVGGAAIGNQVVVLTVGNPYMLTGTSPDTLTLPKLESTQACVSKRSIVVVGGTVFYASPDGLAVCDATGVVTVITEGIFTRDQWQALNPESIHAYAYNGCYIGFYDTGVVQAGFVFDPAEGDAAWSWLDWHATGGYSDMVQDALFLQIGADIVKFAAGGDVGTAVWVSGVTTLPRHENLGAAVVRADTYDNVVFKLYADGVLRHTRTVTSNRPFRLPSGYKAEQYEIEIQADSEVYFAAVGSTMLSLKDI